MEARETTILLNLLSIVLVLGGGLKLITILSNVPNSYYQNIVLSNNRIPIANAIPMQVNPDIYYIILDGYARLDILENLYGYDNSDFLNYFLF